MYCGCLGSWTQWSVFSYLKCYCYVNIISFFRVQFHFLPGSGESPGSSLRGLTRGQCGCFTLLPSYNFFINQYCEANICHIIGIRWFEMQTFCSQALNSLLTAEYLVECVTGRVRCCQEVCVRFEGSQCVSVKESVFMCVLERSGGWLGRALVNGCAIASSQESSKTHTLSCPYTHTHTHTTFAAR